MEPSAPTVGASQPGITPHDLGGHWRRELLKRRAVARVRGSMGYVGVGGETTYGETKPLRRTKLQRFWLRKANLQETHIAEIAPLLTTANTGVSVWRNLAATFSYTFFLWFLAMCGVGVLASSSDSGASFGNWFTAVSLAAPVLWLAWAAQATLFVPRRALRRISTDAVTASEIEAFLPVARGDLDRSYLNTVLQAIQQPVPVDAQAAVRAALRETGDAISSLPGETMPVGTDDAVALRQSAQEKIALAGRESDSLISESLLRQAEEEIRRAQIIESGGTAAKRARARRAEAEAHLQTLRAVLMTYAGADDAARLQLADVPNAVREAATGAASTAQAKREVADSELAALYGQPLPEPVQHVGAGAPATSGKWWRGA